MGASPRARTFPPGLRRSTHSSRLCGAYCPVLQEHELFINENCGRSDAACTCAALRPLDAAPSFRPILPDRLIRRTVLVAKVDLMLIEFQILLTQSDPDALQEMVSTTQLRHAFSTKLNRMIQTMKPDSQHAVSGHTCAKGHSLHHAHQSCSATRIGIRQAKHGTI